MPDPLAPEQLALQAAVAGRFSIELLPPLLAGFADLRERFLREARTAAGLLHPNIVPIHAVEERGGLVYFVMSYLHPRA